MSQITLYGSSLSLYTGRVRSYLIKAGLSYKETTPTTEYFRQQVLPKAGDRQSLPTIETAEGDVIRDGAAIIDHYESINGHRFSPKAPRQKILSLLFDVIGSEGTDKLTHTRGLELQNSCGDTIITDRRLHFERNLMQKEAEYSHF